MSYTHRSLGAVSVLVALAVPAGVALMHRNRRTQPSAATVIMLQPAQVRSLAVESGGQQITLSRDKDDWRSGPGTPLQSANLMTGFESRLLPLRAYRAVEADPGDPQFGLDKPEIVVTIQDTKHAVRKILLGTPSFTGAGYYARVIGGHDNESRHLYLVTRQAMGDFRSLLAGQIIDSPDPFKTKVDELDSEQAHVQQQDELSPWLRQVLDAGARLPVELE